VTVEDLLRTAADDLLADVRSTTDAERALDELVDRPARRRTPWLPLAAAVVVVLGLAAAVLMAVADDDGEPVTSGPTTGPSVPATTLPGPAPGVSEGLAITATPNRDLADGDEVRVTAEGLPSGPGLIELYMCAGDALARVPGMEACVGQPMQSLTAVEGRIETTYSVQQVIPLMEGLVDCARDAVPCSIGVAVNRPVDAAAPPTAGGPELVGVVGVAFAPLEPLADPVLTVTPAEDLEHGQVVTIAGEGFVGSVSRASLCAPPSADAADQRRCTAVALGEGDDFGANEVATDSRGRFSVDVPIWRAFPVLVDSRWEYVDCAEVACTLTLDQDRGEESARSSVPLDFATDPPTPEPPTMDVSPTTGLRPGDPVTITIRGLLPGAETYLYACTLDGGLVSGGCGQSTSLEPVVGEEDGEVTVTLPAVDPAQYGIDCSRFRS